jgi:arylsulfatase A-like enzyme
MNVDMFATVCGMLGLTPPADNVQNGRDFSPLLRGEPVKDWPTTTFGQFDVHIFALDYMRMVRTSDWKLIRHQMFSGSNELYDLKNDPLETRNRYYDKHVADVRDRLQKQLTEWQRSIDDPLLKLDNRPIEPGPPMGQ